MLPWNSLRWIAFAGLTAVLAACSLGGPGSGNAAPAGLPDRPAEQVVADFYDWYMSYSGNPIREKAYQSSEYLAPAMIRELDELVAEGDWRLDPVLCAQDIPNTIEALPAVADNDTATVVVETSFGTSLTVTLVVVDQTWRISDIRCGG